jgi:hypothetical protein
MEEDAPEVMRTPSVSTPLDLSAAQRATLAFELAEAETCGPRRALEVSRLEVDRHRHEEHKHTIDAPDQRDAHQPSEPSAPIPPTAAADDLIMVQLMLERAEILSRPYTPR